MSPRSSVWRTDAEEGAAVEHLRTNCAVLGGLIDGLGPEALATTVESERERPDDHYGALVRSIVGQQLSTKAARSIYLRLCDRYGGRTPTPEEVLAEDDLEAFRAACGLSRSKVSFLRSLAEHVISGDVDLEALDELADEDVVAELIRVKGLGEWTVQMFLMFRLRRPDVLPTGDLGIRRAVERAWELDDMPSPDELTAIAASWRPHRTLACRYLWASLDNAPA